MRIKTAGVDTNVLQENCQVCAREVEVPQRRKEVPQEVVTVSIWDDMYGIGVGAYDYFKKNKATKPYVDLIEGIHNSLEHPQSQADLTARGIVDHFTGIYSALDSSNWLNDYMKNTGLDYSDIKYPSRVSGGSGYANVVTRGMNFVSDNIRRLYR